MPSTCNEVVGITIFALDGSPGLSGAAARAAAAPVACPPGQMALRKSPISRC